MFRYKLQIFRLNFILLGYRIIILRNTIRIFLFECVDFCLGTDDDYYKRYKEADKC